MDFREQWPDNYAPCLNLRAAFSQPPPVAYEKHLA
jgi:hypothetical protein